MHEQPKKRRPEPARADGSKKPYRKPELIHRGDVRDITMGPTPGVGESGNPSIRRP